MRLDISIKTGGSYSCYLAYGTFETDKFGDEVFTRVGYIGDPAKAAKGIGIDRKSDGKYGGAQHYYHYILEVDENFKYFILEVGSGKQTSGSKKIIFTPLVLRKDSAQVENLENLFEQVSLIDSEVIASLKNSLNAPDAIAPIEIAEPPIEIAAPIVEPVVEQLQLVEIVPTVRREYVDPARVTLNAGTQTRVESQERVAQYTDLIATGEWEWERSDIILFEDSQGNLFPSDGHHRIKATIAAGKHFLAEIRSGGLRDAIFESFASNKFHGLPLTREDKNNRVKAILLDSEWQSMSDRSIAIHCNVSAPFVGNIRSNLIAKNDIAPTPIRTGKDGRTTKTKTSSTKSKSAAAPKIDSPLEPITEVAIANVPVKHLVDAVAIVDEELLAAKKRQDAIVKHLNNTENIESGSLTSAKQAVNVLTYQELLEIAAYINELIPVM